MAEAPDLAPLIAAVQREINSWKQLPKPWDVDVAQLNALRAAQAVLEGLAAEPTDTIIRAGLVAYYREYDERRFIKAWKAMVAALLALAMAERARLSLQSSPEDQE